jgi:hypothetical protein
VLVAAGSSGMAQNTSEASTQGSILMLFSSVQPAGQIVRLENAAGEAIVTFMPDKEYQTIVICAPELVQNGEYVLCTGGTAEAVSGGLCDNASWQGGQQLVKFTLSSLVTYLNESGVTTNNQQGDPGGMPGGNQGGFPGGGKGGR